METQITARHFEASSELREHAIRRVAKLERYYDGIVDAHVILDTDGDPATDKTAEITISVYRQRLSAEGAAATHEAAINDCVDRLRRQVLKYKDKLRRVDQDVHK